MSSPQHRPDEIDPHHQPVHARRQWNKTWRVMGVASVLALCGLSGCVAIIDRAADGITSSLASGPRPLPSPDPAGRGQAPVTATSTVASNNGRYVAYEVTSDSTLVSVTYFDPNNETRTESQVAVPWTKTLNNGSTVALIGVAAQTNGLSVSCRVIVDGNVVAQQSASGRFAVVNCAAPTF
ncbi:MmpS family transport accessory protein [Nocardia asteroides]|uniref:MmpS family transport accessory protein n=1 Tax=Nocardia asteroides TaxID=1824 RepID=UPI0037CC3812